MSAAVGLGMILRRQIYVVCREGEGRGSGATATGAGCGLRWDGRRRRRGLAAWTPDAAGLGRIASMNMARCLINVKPAGRRPKLSVEQQEALRQLVEAGPDPEKHGVVRWRCVDLQRVLGASSASICRQWRLAPAQAAWLLAYSARPLHPAQDAQAIAAFKKLPRSGRRGCEYTRTGNADRGRFQDEMWSQRSTQHFILKERWSVV